MSSRRNLLSSTSLEAGDRFGDGSVRHTVRRLWATVGAAVDVFLDPAWKSTGSPMNGHARPSNGWTYRWFDGPDRPAIAPRRRDPSDRNMTDRQLAFIEQLVHGLDPPIIRRFLEVGVYYGVTTSLLARYGPTVVVDWWLGNEEAVQGVWYPSVSERSARLRGFLDTVEDAGIRPSVTVLTGNSHAVLPSLRNDRFGLVLVDGDHSESGAYADIRDTWPVVEPGGWLPLDDYSRVVIDGGVDNPVQRAWERFSRERGLGGDLFTPDDDPAPKLVAVRKERS